MEIEFGKQTMKFNKELNALDMLAIDFCRVLNPIGISYVIISGYIAILFGRNRASEDIDIFIEKMDKAKFSKLWNSLKENSFICINADVDEAFSLLEDGLAPRFAKTGEAMPNMEVKFPKTDLDFYSLKNRIKVDLNQNILYIGPLELNIAFKLFIGSEKDIEDARFQYKLFQEKLDTEKLKFFINQLKVTERAEKYLWKTTKT